MTSARRRTPKPTEPPGGRDAQGEGRDRRDGHGDGHGDGHAPVFHPRRADVDRVVDPRAVRLALSAAFAHVDLPALVVEPPPTPVAPTPRVLGLGILGGVSERPALSAPSPATDAARVLVDGEPSRAVLRHLDAERATLAVGDPSGTTVRVVLEASEAPADGRGAARREVVVDGWRIEVDVESERRAALRDRARRGREESAHGGPTEVHAIIPGRVVSVSIAPGDAVVASQQLLVVEAMKMQNELHAPRDGTVTRVGVAPGDTIEIGDLLLVLE